MKLQTISEKVISQSPNPTELKSIFSLFTETSEAERLKAKEELMNEYMSLFESAKQDPKQYKTCRVLDELLKYNKKIGKMLPAVECRILIAYASYKRLADKPWIAKSYMEQVLQICDEHELDVDAKVYLDFGIVAHQLKNELQAVHMTRECLRELDWKASKEYALKNERAEGGRGDEKYANERLRAIAHYNLMTFLTASNKLQDAKREGEKGVRVIRKLMLQLKNVQDAPDDVNQRKASDNVQKVQVVVKDAGNSNNNSKSRHSIQQQAPDNTKTRKSMRKQQGEEEGVVKAIGTATHDIKQQIEECKKIEYRMFFKLKNVLKMLKLERADQDDHDDDVQSLCCLKIKSNAPAKKSTSSKTMFTIKDCSKSIDRTSILNTSEDYKLASRSSKPSLMHHIAQQYKRPISNSTTGVKLKNSDLSSFLTKPLYYLDEYANDNDKRQLKHCIGRSIRKCAPRIYSQPRPTSSMSLSKSRVL